MKLSKQSKQILKELKEESPQDVEDFEKKGYDQSMVNRAALELEEEGLVEVEEEENIVRTVTEKGRKVLEEGSPEHRLLQKVEDKSKNLEELNEINLDVALGKAREKDWVKITDGKVSIKNQGEDALEEDVVQQKMKIKQYDDELEERGLIGSETKTRKKISLTSKAEKIDLDEIKEDFNVEASVKTPRVGKKHFYKDILDYAREKWLEMGFKEMNGDFIVPSLLNFDALYTPQDHPARELHDTFFMDNPKKSDLSVYGDKVDHIKETHENGWTTRSTGWGYDWSREEAAKNVLRTHTTAVSIRRIHDLEVNEEELPKKFFTISRNFRNETVDRHHLAEFLQTDGIVVGEDLSFRNLKAYISEFFEKMGYEEFRLVPSYYPYTEMSVEVQVWDQQDEEWLGMGGAGMFRPEVVKPMLGFEATVLAWGLGIGRIALIAAGLDDIRELYRNDLEILENTPKWRPEK